MTKTKKQKPAQTAQEKDLERAKDQAKTQYESIAEMVQALNEAGDDDQEKIDQAMEAIQQDPLSVEVRGGWYQAGGEKPEPEEFRILLCTGGPAVRIIGELNDYNEPDKARLEYQDWFTPWVDYPLTSDQENTLLTYARQFYFGE